MARDPNHKTKSARKDLLVTDVPSEIRKALVSEAKARDCSINKVAVQILATAFKVKYVEPVNGLRGHEGAPRYRTADPSTLLVRGGAKLHRAITADAARRGGTLRGVVLEKIALNFQIEPQPIGRRPRKKAA